MKTLFLRSIWIVTLCACVVGLPLNEGAAAADKAGSPPAVSQQKASIEIPKKEHSFGEALEGSEVSHDFVVRNTGNAVLQIEQVRPG
jgi:hypothetical protein